MAEDAVEQLLLKFGVDLTQAKQAGSGLKQLFDELNALSKQVTEQGTAAVQLQKGLLDQLKNSAQAAVTLAKQAVAEETAKVATIKTQTAEMQKQTVQKRLDTETTKQQVAEEAKRKATLASETQDHLKHTQELRAQTAEIQKQIAEIRKRKAEEAGERRGGGEGGALPGGLRSGIGRAIFGQGLAGGVAAGVIAGAGITGIIESATLAAEHFIERIKEITIEAGKLSQVQDQFEKLAKGAGVDAGEAILKLQQNTDGLVSKFDLLRLATAALKSPFGLSIAQVEKLAGDVVALSRAAGKSPEEGLNSLARALQTGRFQALAAATGLSRFQLQLSELPPHLNRVQRGAAEAQHAIEELGKQRVKLGDIPATLAEGIKQIRVAATDVLDEFGKGFNEAPGTQLFLKVIGGLTASYRSFGEAAETIGRNLGTALAAVGPVLLFIKSLFVAIVDIVGDIGSIVSSVFGVIIPDNVNKAALAVKILGGGFLVLASILDDIAKAVDAIVNPLQKVIDVDKAFLSGDKNKFLHASQQMIDGFKKAKGEIAELFTGTDLQAKIEAYYKQVDDAFSGKHIKGITTEPPPGGLTRRDREQLEQAQMKLQEHIAEAFLTARQLNIDREKQLEQEAYAAGEVSAADHYAKLKDIAERGGQARLDEIATTLRAELDLLAKQHKDGTLLDDLYNTKVADASVKAGKQQLQAAKQLESQLSTLQRQQNQDELQAHLKLIHDELAAEQERIRAEQSLTEKRFAGGETSPDAYFQERIAQSQQLAEAEIDNAYKVYEANKQSLTAAATLQTQLRKIRQTEEEQITAIVESEGEKRLRSIQREFGLQQQVLQEQVNFAEKNAGRGAGGALGTLLQSTLDSLKAEQNALFSAINKGVEKGSDEWYQYISRLEQVYQKQQQVTDQLRAFQDILPDIATLFGSIGQEIGTIFTSKFAQNLSSVLQQAEAAVKQTQSRFDIILNRGTVQKDPLLQQLENEAAGLFKQVGLGTNAVVQPLNDLKRATLDLTDGFKALRAAQVPEGVARAIQAQPGYGVPGAPAQGVASQQSDAKSGRGLAGAVAAGVSVGSQQGSLSQGLFGDIKSIFGGGQDSPFASGAGFKKFSAEIGAAIGAIAGFADTLIHSKSAITGALGGGLQGASIGAQLGGPIGAAIGAAVGVTLGAIFGHKNAEVQRNINNATIDFRNIMNDFATNSNNLQLTIAELTALLNTVKAEQASSKKGHGDYQKLIDQYTQQIIQLQQQQHQIIVNMNEQLAILNAPTGMQDYLNNLEQILKQYQQFRGAAANARELADANTYLSKSLQQYEQTLSTQFLQDNQTAINDALQLNDLLYQRQQLILDTNKQVVGVLSQGVLVRQATRAQTAGQEIQQIQYQAQRQLDVMNEQIAATQYRVAQEGIIFNLANTRVGLEMQLLGVQQAQTDLDMQRIKALSLLLSNLKAGNWDFGAIAALLGAIPGTTTPVAGPAPPWGNKYAPPPIHPPGTRPPGQGPPPPGWRPGPPGFRPPAYGPGPSEATGILDYLIAGSYQDRSNLGYASYRGQNL